MESSGSGVVDFGRFLTGFFVVMGIGKWPARRRMSFGDANAWDIAEFEAQVLGVDSLTEDTITME
jgi:hypothetical protein